MDTVLFDIQDVGARFYTYIWTLYDCMAAARLAGKRVVVLDRPNPVTGRAALGPVLRKEFATFIGREPIAQAHGMTVGELARLFNGEFLTTPVALDVVRMTGWKRSAFHDGSGLPWVPPSPNMPTPETALVYAGTCLFEGTNLSEGRGTTRPFELLGAEGVDGRWAAAVNELRLPGVHFREAYFAPTFSKFQGKTVGGVQVHVHDRAVYDPVRTGIALLVTAKRSWPGFAWRPDHWIDKLTGSTRVRTLIDAGAGVDDVVADWQPELAAFREVREEYLLYCTAGGGPRPRARRRPEAAHRCEVNSTTCWYVGRFCQPTVRWPIRAQGPVDDRVGAPLVARRAVRVAGVDLDGGPAGRLLQGAGQDVPAGGEAAAAAVPVRERSAHRLAEDRADVLVDMAPPAVLEGAARVGAGRAVGGRRGFVDGQAGGERAVQVAAEAGFERGLHQQRPPGVQDADRVRVGVGPRARRGDRPPASGGQPGLASRSTRRRAGRWTATWCGG
ncbi:hypothetical protein SGLAM104S_00879 [Streptomyces glaucescens]